MESGQMIAEAIDRLVKERGTNPRAVALAAGMSPTGVRDIITRKTKNPTFANLLKISEVLDVEVGAIIGNAEPTRPTIAVAGKVGAGAQVPLFDAYEKGDGPQVECPPGLSPHGVVAVEVEGDSMEPVYSAGDLLFYTRDSHEGVPADVIGHRCVCEDADGMGWVKQVKPGDEPGLFHLISLNPGATTMWNVRLRWAARVRLHWPADLARKK
ncbi:S24 family peptidase [Phaeobacter gallaeciensis]|uniref:S24 family peptidase n=1 Tax=Phaeobacter gallaeciensis TaxID=60890 RepID=UPI00238094E1|nr:S24 family peptidase [Phaeobacter gallaeciensis]MDE4274738.1 S24 family peptidase [Phaeobacter gallaeciensis]MDE4299688.1 S24 family peptidase [Phaeobacter gallaeciensis]MDE5184853.1 S24 family peptidase [Phaeobacter gallaeciensis]